MAPLHRVLRGWWALGLALLAPIQIDVVMAGPSIQGTVTIVEKSGKPKARNDGVVVFLDELEHPPSVSAPTAHAVMRQADKTFIPKVLPILVGTTVDFPNDDTISHNVFSLSKVKPFDLGLYARGTNKSVTFDQPGLVKVYCNIHSQMVGYILVLANPYFTMAGPDGHFVIREVPQGTAVARAWYPYSHEQPQQKIRLTAQGIQDLNLQIMENLHFEIKEETLSIEHKNKFGQDYPTKY